MFAPKSQLYNKQLLNDFECNLNYARNDIPSLTHSQTICSIFQSPEGVSNQ